MEFGTPASYLLPLKSVDGQEHMLALHESRQLWLQHSPPCALRFSELVVRWDGHGWVEDLRHLALPIQAPESFPKDPCTILLNMFHTCQIYTEMILPRIYRHAYTWERPEKCGGSSTAITAGYTLCELAVDQDLVRLAGCELLNGIQRPPV